MTMKINDIQHISSIATPKNQKKAETTKTAFKDLLETTMDAADTSRTIKPESATSARMTQPSFTTMPIDREEAVSRVSQFLDIMEEYSIKLSTKKCSLRDIAPLVSRIETGIEELRILSRSLPDDDSIKEILDQSLIRSSVEVIKFNRGDYL